MEIYIKRDDYLNKLKPYYDDKRVKVIYGVRGCGKSIFLRQVQDDLRLNGLKEDHIIYLNSKNMKYREIKSYRALYKFIRTLVIDNNKYYILIDDIDYIKEYEKALIKIKENINSSIFVVVRNPNLLEGIDNYKLKINPFSFKEAYEYKKIEEENLSPYEFIFDYLSWGGFPKRFQYGNNEEKIKECLNDIYEDIIRNDLMDKKREIDIDRVKRVSTYILESKDGYLSSSGLISYFKEEYDDTFDKKVLYNYLNKMEEACLISRAHRYDIKGKHLMKYIEKDYVVDTGLRRINTPSTRIQDTNFLENIIYNELVNRGYKVYVGKTYKGEVDFVVTFLNKKCYIQVAYVLASPEIIQREFDAFNPIKDACPKYVFSLDRWDFSGDGICNINIVDFLLGKRDILLT